MSDESDDALDGPLPAHSARMEGRIRAVEGILRANQSTSQAGSGALQHLRDGTVSSIAQPETMNTERQPQLRYTETPDFKHATRWLAGAVAAIVFGCLSLWMSYSPGTSERLTINEVQGDAIVEMDLSTRKAQPRTWLFPGQRIVVKPGGSARLRFDDDTLLELPGDSILSLESSRRGKSVKLEQGLCRFSVKPQLAGETLTIHTPNASIKVLGTTFAVASRGSETEVDVESGKVKLARFADGNMVQLSAGQSAVAAAGRELSARKISFVLGVNLGGRAVTIEGNRWLGYREALSSGLSHGHLSVWDHPNFKLRQPQDADLTAMLQSGVWTNEGHNDSPLVLRQPLPNGEYKVYVWSVENAFNYMRRLTLSLNGERVATGIACVPYGDWAKCGPYTARVTNGVLEMEIGRLNNNGGERHINGYAIYRVGEE